MSWPPPEAVDTVMAPASSPARRLIGFALLLPALAALVWQLVVPTLSTIIGSLREYRGFSTPGGWAGAENYRGLALGRPLLFGVSLALLPILAALVVGPLIGGLASGTDRRIRLTTRALIAVPVAFFCPAGLYVTDAVQRVTRADSLGISTSGRAMVTLLGTGFTGSLGIVCAISATVFLLASSREADGARAVGTVATSVWTGVVMTLTLVAVGLQAFALPLIVTGGGPGGATTTPALAMLQRAFTVGRVGTGYSISTILLVMLGFLGIAAVNVVTLGMRLVIADPRPAAATDRTSTTGKGVGVAAVVGAGVVLVLALLFARHWLASSAVSIGVGQGRPFFYTWVPAVLGSAVQLVVTGLAVAGIGAFRPLGRYSEWLLLAFAPWLFVGSAPLALAHYLRLADGGHIGGLIDQLPRVFVDIPVLVALTFVAAAAGRYRVRHRSDRSRAQTLRELAVPVGAVALVVTGACVLINAQRVLWPYLISLDAAKSPAQVTLLHAVQQVAFGSGHSGTAELYPLPLIVVFAALAAMAAIGLDRIALRSAREGVAQR